MLVRDRRTSSAKGAFGRHERHESEGMRLVTAAFGWRSSVRKLIALIVRHAGQRTHRNQLARRDGGADRGRKIIGARNAWRVRMRRNVPFVLSAPCQNGALAPQSPHYFVNEFTSANFCAWWVHTKSEHPSWAVNVLSM